MSGTPSEEVWVPPLTSDDPAEQQRWALENRQHFLKGYKDDKDDSQRAVLVHWCLSHIDLFRTLSLTKWEEEARLFMNIQQRRDHSNPSKLLGPSGSWVKEWRAVREKEEKESGTIPRDGDFPEAMDQWLLIINEKLEKERTARKVKSSKDLAAEYRESEKRRFAENVLDRRNIRLSEDSENSEDKEEKEVPWSSSLNPEILPIARRGSRSVSRSVSRSHSTTLSHRVKKLSSQRNLVAKALNRFTDVFKDRLKALAEPLTTSISIISEI